MGDGERHPGRTDYEILLAIIVFCGKKITEFVKYRNVSARMILEIM